MKIPVAVLDETTQEWLDCYDAHRKFIVATKKLFYAFAAGWNGPRRALWKRSNPIVRHCWPRKAASTTWKWSSASDL
jgi:hypothetical protein